MAASFMLGYVLASSPFIVRTMLGMGAEAAATAVLRVASAGLSGTVNLVRRVCRGRERPSLTDQEDEEPERPETPGECVVEVLSCNRVPVIRSSWCPALIGGEYRVESLDGVWYGPNFLHGLNLCPVESAAMLQTQEEFVSPLATTPPATSFTYEGPFENLFIQHVEPLEASHTLAPVRAEMLRELRERIDGRNSRLSMLTSSSSIDSLDPYENTGDFPVSPDDPMLQSLPGVSPSPPPSLCSPVHQTQLESPSSSSTPSSRSSTEDADVDSESVWSIISTDRSEALASSSPSTSASSGGEEDDACPPLQEELLHLSETESDSDKEDDSY